MPTGTWINGLSNAILGSTNNPNNLLGNMSGNAYGGLSANPTAVAAGNAQFAANQAAKKNFIGPIAATTNPSATTPVDPKTQYIQTQAQNLQPANLSVQTNPTTTTYNSQYGLGFGNGSSFNANGIQTQAPTQTPSQTPQNTPTGFNATSGANGTGVYDPYNSPAYQQYVQNAAAAAQPNAAISGYQTQLQQLQQQAQQGNIALESNPNLSNGALVGQQNLEAQQFNAQEQNAQTGLANALTLQQYQQNAANIPLTAANTQAGYLAGFSNPQTLSPGQTSISANPSTGQTQTLGSVGSYSFGTGIAGQPIAQSQTTGAINSGGTNAGLGATPPALGSSSAQNSALQSVAQTYGLTDPASQLALQTAVQQTLASNGDVNAAGVPANMQNAVKAVLSQMNSGYSPLGSTIASGVTTQQQQQIAQYTSSLQQGQNLQSQLSDLIGTFGLNPSNVNAANSGLQTIASNTSNPYYKQLQNYVNDVANTYAQILTPPGGSSTDTTRSIATSMLDATASGTSIQSTLASLDNAAKAKIAGISTTPNTNSSNSSSFSNGQTAAGGALVYKNGQWVAAQ